MVKNVITDEQRADAKRLKAIYSSKAKSLGITQEKLGIALGGSGQSTASNYINGITALNLKAALIFARELQVDVAEFSPSLSNLVKENRETLPAQTSFSRIKELMDRLPESDQARIVAMVEAYLGSSLPPK